MNSRVYLNNDDMFRGAPPRIEYYDYDLINEDGTSKLYRFEFSEEVFENDIKDFFTEKGRNDEYVIIDLFTAYEGWNDLKSTLEDMDLDFRYEVITLTREERLKIQEGQYGEHRCVIVHSYRNCEDIDAIDDLNEYEKAQLAYLNEKYKGIALDIPFDWEEKAFKFLMSSDEYEAFLEDYYAEIGMTPEEADQLYYVQLLDKLLGEKISPTWCGLLEEMDGQISNYMTRIGEYELAKQYHPNIKNYSLNDFMFASSIDDIPEDWLQFACACLEKMGKSGWEFGSFKTVSAK